MPRAKPKPESVPQPQPQPTVANGPADEVLTLAEAAAYLKLSETDVAGLVQTQSLPGRYVAGQWRFLKAAIQQWLATGPTPKSNKEAWMALAGVWKDDPHLEEVLQEIHKQKERATAKDES